MLAARAIFFAVALLVATMARAEFKVPAMGGPVMDEAHVLPPQAQRVIEEHIRAAFEAGFAQIQVLLLPTLDGLTAEEAAIKIFDQWKLGEAKQNNGVLFLIALNDHRMRIEVGRGLEGVIPDIVAKQILADHVAPFMRQGQVAEGVLAGVDGILHRVQNPNEVVRTPHARGRGGGPDNWITIALFILFIILSLLRRSAGFGGIYWGGGGWGGGSGGGSGGGGWSGGGGGSAGGGASSDW